MSGRVGDPDPVGAADAVRRDVAERLAAVVGARADEEGGDDGDDRERSDRVPDVYVGWTAALDVARCPARYRADGADGWGFPGWSPTLASGAVGRAALARHLHDIDRDAAPAAAAAAGPDETVVPLPAPPTIVRAWLRDAARAPTSPVAEWLAELVRSGDRTSVAATAAAATRWVAGFVRTHGWPLPDRLGVIADDADGPHTRRWVKRWRPGRGSPLCVASSPDAVVGKLTAAGAFDLVVHRPSSPPEDALADRAAFEAMAGALSAGIVAASVVVSTGDSAERARFPITPALLRRGADLVVDVVRQRLVAAKATDDPFADATPGPACRHCPHSHGQSAHGHHCPPGQAWLATPVGRRRGGLPLHG